MGWCERRRTVADLHPGPHSDPHPDPSLAGPGLRTPVSIVVLRDTADPGSCRGPALPLFVGL